MLQPALQRPALRLENTSRNSADGEFPTGSKLLDFCLLEGSRWEPTPMVDIFLFGLSESSVRGGGGSPSPFRIRIGARSLKVWNDYV